jgi:mannose-6-phosphate isomerase
MKQVDLIKKIDSNEMKILKIKGKSRHYLWGGTEFIPNLLNLENSENQPFAEYWLGAHNSSPAKILTKPFCEANLLDIIDGDPQKCFGENSQSNTLPYLVKILDVKTMLSIQVHPSKKAAEEGYAIEEAKGIPLTADNRNYKDKNHKPELMYALSEFWLLHGFQTEEVIRQRLHARPIYSPMLEILNASGSKALFEWIVLNPKNEAHKIADNLFDILAFENESHKSSPDFWIQKWFKNDQSNRTGVLTLLLLNVVNLKKGDAIYQAPEMLHAYLEGQGIEVMASSDNVLRGGLTSKHVDSLELIKNTNCSPTNSLNTIIHGFSISQYEKKYTPPIEDFELSEIILAEGDKLNTTCSGMELFINMEGNVSVKFGDGDKILVKTGESFVGIDGAEIELSCQVERVRLFRTKVNI